MKSILIGAAAVLLLTGAGCTTSTTINGNGATVKEAVSIFNRVRQLQPVMQEHAQLIVDTQSAGVYEDDWTTRGQEGAEHIEQGRFDEGEAVFLELNAEMRAALDR